MCVNVHRGFECAMPHLVLYIFYRNIFSKKQACVGVSHVVESYGTYGRLGSTKTGRVRYVDMSAQLAKVLKEWKLACPHSSHGLVFPNSEGEYTDAKIC